MTNRNNSTLLAFLQHELDYRGAKNIGLPVLDRLRTIIEQYLEDCCLLPIPPFSSNFLRTAHNMLKEMTGVPIKHKLQPVLRLLNSILNCCPDYVTPEVFNFRVNATDGQVFSSFSLDGTENFQVIVDWGDGSIETYKDSIGYITSHEYLVEGEYDVIVKVRNAQTVTAISFGTATNLTSIENTHVFQNLVSLAMPTNSIETFDPATALSASLITLDLSANKLTTFNPTLPLPNNLVNLTLTGNQLTSFALSTPIPATLQYIGLDGNNLGVTAVNNALVYLAGQTFNAGPKILNITQDPAAAPTGAGATAVTTLEANGWIVTTD